MYFIIAVTTAITVYVATFKDSFTKEHIDKIIPFIAACVAVIVVLNMISLLL